MKKKLILLLAIVLILPSMVWAEADLTSYEAVNLKYFEEILSMVKKDYPFDVKEEELLEGALKGMLQSLDPYSDYYTREEAERLMGEINGSFTGIGVYIEEEDGYVRIWKTIKDGPADRADIRKDDLIISIDGIDIEGMGLEEVISLLKGEPGTELRLGIQRGKRVLDKKLIREVIEIDPVAYEIIEGDIGYIDLESFNSQSSRAVKKALDLFYTKGINRIIVDIRDNPGGFFGEALAITEMLVPKGDLVHQRMGDDSLVTYRKFRDTRDYQLVVLVNENSASASEILAGAVKDRKSGTIIGRKTFGKGIVQSLIPGKGGSLVKLTTAEYLTANKTSIHGIGIEPDIEVINTNMDKQLERAIEILR